MQQGLRPIFSITTLTLCSFLPTSLFRFAAGAMADQWDKKRITLLAIRIPKIECDQRAAGESVWQSCLSGLRYLKEHPHLLRLILFIAAVNFLAKLGPDGQMPAFILSRTNGSEAALGAVQSSVALGLLTGGMAVAVMKPAPNRIKTVFRMCSLIFLAGMGLALSRDVIGWCAAAFLQYLFAAVMNVHWNTVMRSTVPPWLQGRVFSARDTIQNCTIPLGLYLGGMLTDNVFEPLMAKGSGVQHGLSCVFGEGSGAGIAALFFLVALAGFVLSVVCMNRRSFQGRKDGSLEAGVRER